MTGSVARIEGHVAAIKAERIAWLDEKPTIPPASMCDAETFLRALRDEYRWYLAQRERLVSAHRALCAMIEDCDVALNETQAVADLMADVNEKLRQADQHAGADGRKGADQVLRRAASVEDASRADALGAAEGRSG